ncbi:MAG: polyhydroxyalkanoate synthesis regulator DNA-binding domain-containing protein [Myxococcota bacterium]
MSASPTDSASPSQSASPSESGSPTESDGSASAPGGREARLIKRYANRKLYDTRDSRYVTLQQVAVFVREGEDVQIIDNKSKEDLTNVTLAQIIYEEEKKGESETRKSTLRSFIQDGRERIITSLPASISKLVRREDGEDAPHPEDVAEAAKAVAEAVAAASDDGATKASETSPGKKPALLDDLRAMADERIRAVFGSALGHVSQLQNEVGRLQIRIEELETKLQHLAGRDEAPKDEGE